MYKNSTRQTDRRTVVLSFAKKMEIIKELTKSKINALVDFDFKYVLDIYHTDTSASEMNW